MEDSELSEVEPEDDSNQRSQQRTLILLRKSQRNWKKVNWRSQQTCLRNRQKVLNLLIWRSQQRCLRNRQKILNLLRKRRSRRRRFFSEIQLQVGRVGRIGLVWGWESMKMHELKN